MSMILLSVIITILVACNVFGQVTKIDRVDTTIILSHPNSLIADTVKIDSFSFRKIPNNAFDVGEYLKFEVRYGFVTAGDAVISVSDTVFYNNRKSYKIEFSVDSRPFFNWIYKVEDRYFTLIDVEGIFPWRFEQKIREGKYRRDFTAEFDQLNGIARTNEGVYPIPRYVQDIMSAFFYTRTVDFSEYKPGQKLQLQNFYKDSTYSLDVKFKGRQVVEVPAGKFRCIILEPLAKEGGLFKSEGKIYIWLTDDERKMPVKVSTKILIGSIESELVEYRGLKGPLTSKVFD